VPDESIDIRVRLKDVRRAIADAESVSRSVDHIGDAGRRSSKGLDATTRSARSGRGHLRKLGAAAIVAGAGLLSIGAAKSAIDTTIGLAKSTKALSTNLFHNNVQANRWAVAAKARGIDTSTLSLSFTNLSKNAVAAAGGSRKHASALQREIASLDARDKRIKDAIAGGRAQQVLNLAHVSGNKAATASLRARGVVELADLRRQGALIQARKTAATQQLKALQGNKGAIAAFKTLGITQKDLVRGLRPGGFQSLLNRVADGLARIPGSARKAAIAQKLLGRSTQTTLPIFAKGSKSMNENLRLADKYHVILTGKAAPSLQEMITAQKELEIAQLGWQVTFATKVAPALTKLILLGTRVSLWMQKHPTLVKVLIGAFVALAIAVWAVGVALSVIALGAGGAIALGVILGLLAIGAGLVFLYTRFGRFRAVVDAVLGFVKKHWPLLVGILTGPIGLAVIYIIRNWDRVVRFFSKLPGRIANATKGMWDGIKSSFRSAINFIIRGWNNLAFHFKGKKLRGLPDIPAFTIGTPDIPLLAGGGRVHPGGRAVVGESGAELLTNVAGTVEVAPLSQGREGGILKASAPVILKLDNRVLAKAYVDFSLGELARS
jgi:hypothetical protein